jgi:hypothetical protein
VFDSLLKLQRIENYAFAWTALTALVIPGCVSSFAALGWAGLLGKHFHFQESERHCICDSFMQDFSGQIVIRYFGLEVSIVINSSVKVIGGECFSSCK